ncbi:MAG TPA: hypothetical protein VFR90_04050 [Methylibium sp.]|uniref:hypothetical protein n=1 Tax=Methylibium sp. TaxID=2067992 RepID=UPI002DC037B4|nr:hypothetical protein [Methylibium sp.]HEU4458272.1 hypothetical protein [Methylibium sp.]
MKSKRMLSIGGQSMTEYLVGLAVVTAIVAVPFDGRASLVEYFIDMVRIAYLRFFTAIALPA